MAKIEQNQMKSRNTLSVILLLLAIALLAGNFIFGIVKYSAEQTYRKEAEKERDSLIELNNIQIENQEKILNQR